MTEMTSYLPGTPSWVDISTSEMGRTQAFYVELFDWDVEEVKNSGGYTLFKKGGRAVAGAGPTMSPGQPTTWMTYVSVTSADATAKAAAAAGGAVLFGPSDVMDRGRVAVLADTSGARISIWQPKVHLGAELVNEPGSFCWNELQTRVPEPAKAFYSQVFGWGERTSDFGGMAYTEWLRHEDSIAGMMEMPPSVPEGLPAFWLVYFGVADCDATVTRSISLGATVLVPPFDSPAGRFAVLQDPLGASLALIALEG